MVKHLAVSSMIQVSNPGSFIFLDQTTVGKSPFMTGIRPTANPFVLAKTAYRL